MRRHSRGTQLSIIGWRDVTLCSRCDAAVLATLGSDHTPIPEDYVSAALLDVSVDAAAVRPRRKPSKPAPAQASSSRRVSHEPAVEPPRPSRSSPPPPPEPTTVRQALERSQTILAAAGESLDPTVILLLGQRLGPATRLDELDRAGHDPQAIRDWVEGTWGVGDNAAKARHTITVLADHWRLQGWTTTDMAAELRPEEDS